MFIFLCTQRKKEDSYEQKVMNLAGNKKVCLTTLYVRV